MDREGYASLRVQVEGATKLERRKTDMVQVQENDSIMLFKADSFTFTYKYSPIGRVGRFLSRFFWPEGKVTVTVVELNVVGGSPCVRLLVGKVS